MSVANHRIAFRPLRAGTQIYQPDNKEAGTLGLFLTSDGVDRWLLTCAHVLARSDGSLFATDRITQPDLNGGVIATLAGIVSDSTLDCAAVQIGMPVSDEILGIGSVTPAAQPVVGMRVIKSGWKTGVTEGRVQQVAGNDVVIERLAGYPLDYLLAAPGDSGAIWVDANSHAPIAMHKREPAVGPHLAFALPFSAILTALQLHQV